MVGVFEAERLIARRKDTKIHAIDYLSRNFTTTINMFSHNSFRHLFSLDFLYPYNIQPATRLI